MGDSIKCCTAVALQVWFYCSMYKKFILFWSDDNFGISFKKYIFKLLISIRKISICINKNSLKKEKEKKKEKREE